MTYTVPTPSTVTAGDTFAASSYNILSANDQDHEARIKTGVESYTTSQKNALTGVATGTVIYESTLKVFQFYTGSAWVNNQGTPPSLTTAQKTALGTPATGTMVFDSTLNYLQIWTGTEWTRYVVSAPSAMVYRTTNLSYPTSNTDIMWETVAHDTDSMWSAGSPYRLTIKTAGVYVVSYRANFSATTVTGPMAILLWNGNASFKANPVNLGGGAAYTTVTGVVAASVNDTIQASWQFTAYTGTPIITGSATIANGLCNVLSATMIARTT